MKIRSQSSEKPQKKTMRSIKLFDWEIERALNHYLWKTGKMDHKEFLLLSRKGLQQIISTMQGEFVIVKEGE